jgi:hypothetical protein
VDEDTSDPRLLTILLAFETKLEAEFPTVETKLLPVFTIFVAAEPTEETNEVPELIIYKGILRI